MKNEIDQAASTAVAGQANQGFHGLRVNVVLPALNEAKNIPQVFRELPEGLNEVILVDGNSIDDTVAIARSLRPDIRIVAQHNKGKGDALACGLAAAQSGDVIVLLDADGSTDPSEISHFVDAIAAGADFVTGSRYLPGGGSDDLTLYRSFGCRVLSILTNLVYGTKYTDINYGYNVMRTTCLQWLRVDCPGFEVESLMNIRAAKLGLKVAEVPCYERARFNGSSNLHPIRDGLRVLRVILRERFKRTEPTAHVYVVEPAPTAELA
jgi:glycosyltransferase involved in cell wall biosynthesis